jgi:hypothetical protein
MRIPSWGDVTGAWKSLLARLIGLRIPAQCASIYYESARAEYLSQKGLPGSRTDPTAEDLVSKLDQEFKDDPDKVTMNDALFYERLVARFLPPAALRRKVMNLRWRYRQMVSPETYQAYIDSGPPNPLEAKDEEIQADIDDLLGRMQLVYVITPFREAMRTRISLRVIGIILIAALLMIALVRFRYGESLKSGEAPGPEASAVGRMVVPPILVALLAGAIGGLASVQQRIQSAPGEGDAIRSVLSLYDGMFSIYLSPVVGAVSAGLLFLLLVANYLSGDLLPKMETPRDGDAALDLRTFFLKSGPIGGLGYAKLIIWSFLAGFTERLVPDALTRIVTSVQAQANSPPRPVAQAPTTAPRPQPGPAGPDQPDGAGQGPQP